VESDDNASVKNEQLELRHRRVLPARL